MRKRDWVIFIFSCTVLGFLLFNYTNNYNKVREQDKVSNSYERVSYNDNYSKFLTLKKNAQSYENYLFSYLLGINTSLENMREDGVFESENSLSALYSKEIPKGYTYSVSYYYDKDRELLTQVLVLTLESKRIETYLYTIYNSDLQVVDQFTLNQEPYL